MPGRRLLLVVGGIFLLLFQYEWNQNSESFIVIIADTNIYQS